MISQKHHPVPQPASVFAHWLRLPSLAWWRWSSSMCADGADLGADTAPLPAGLAAPVDIDLSLLESLPSIHWVTEAAESPRKDFSDTWRTRPNVRFVGPAAPQVLAGDEPGH
jgi:hypothetical protein